MSKICIGIPCYNEEANLEELYNELKKMMVRDLPEYDYEFLFVDNKSKDHSRQILRSLCQQDSRVKAIFNRVNCGPNTNAFFVLQQSDGDCTILLCADFQEPLEMIPTMVKKWEEGNKVICMIKTESEENKLVYLAREVFYRVFKSMSDVDQIKQYTGFGLYDKSFLDIIRNIKDNTPCVKGIVAEYAPDRLEIPYKQRLRKGGHSSLNFMGYYDSAMLSFTSYTRSGLRALTFFGGAFSIFGFIMAIVYLIRKLMYWNDFTTGNAPILICVLFFGGCELMFLGIMSEYILNINKRVLDRPMVVVEEKINFECEQEDNNRWIY